MTKTKKKAKTEARADKRSGILDQARRAALMEELGAQLLLQRGDLVAHRGLRDEALFRRAGEAAVVGHRDQVLELPELHSVIV